MGTRLGRYDILRTLVTGELTDLLLARREGMEGFQRHVAIKRLHAAHAQDKACLDAFVNEARLAAALHHHNVVQVLDIGEANGQPFFAMEYVHGVDLRALLNKLSKRNEQLPMQHVVSIIAAAAAALHHAHEQKGPDGEPLGIVHRDVTPANIIVGFDGNVKVVDFGIAKAAIRRVSTDQGVLKGRAPYMAPEQCAGKVVDRRSDVFALGIVAFELATVRRLFKGANDFLTMSAVVNADIPKPSQFRPDIPSELEQIMLKALARNPAGRFQTAGEMALALDQVAVKVGVGASTTQLASYMRLQFGSIKEPWLDSDFEVDTETTQVDFDGDAAGLAAPAAESVKNNAIPKSIAATRSSPIAQARNIATPAKAAAAAAPKENEPTPLPLPETPKVSPKPFAAKPPIDKSYSVATEVEAVSYDQRAASEADTNDEGDEHEPTVRSRRKKSDAEPNEAITTKASMAAAIEPTEIVVPLPSMPAERPVVRRATSKLALSRAPSRSKTVLWIFAALAVVALVAGAVVMWPSAAVPTEDKSAEANPAPAVVPAVAPAVAPKEEPPKPDTPAQSAPTHDEADAQQSSGLNATMADYSGSAAKPAPLANANTVTSSGAAKSESAKADASETSGATGAAKPTSENGATAKVVEKPDKPVETVAKPVAAKAAKRTPPKVTPKPAVATKRPTQKPTAKKPAGKKPGTKWNPDELFLGD